MAHHLPTYVRSALLSDAAPSVQKSIKRWSLRSLANINIDPSVGVPPKPPRSDVAETLLNDVMLRLAGQHARTISMIVQAEAILGASDDGRQLASDAMVRGEGKSSIDTASSTGNRPKIIRALNQPVRLPPKVQMQYDTQSQSEKKRALKNLADLEMLHTGTYKLVHEMLDNDAPTLRRYTAADAALVAATFESIRSRHAMSVEIMADIVIGLRRARSLRAGIGLIAPAGQFCGIDLNLIDDFLRERLGVQLLCDHYVALDKGKKYGGIAVGCSLGDVVEDAVTEARHVCDANLGTMPDVQVEYGYDGSFPLPPSLVRLVDPQVVECGYDSVDLTLIRPWLHHALVEILKNAMASSVQRAHDSGEMTTPSEVHVRIVDGLESVSVVIMDQGVGLSEDGMRRAFRFAESSSLKRWDRIEEQTSYAMVRQPLGSLGVGLPLSRMMCRMFGGDVAISNRGEGGGFGSGCTAVIQLLRDDTYLEGPHS